MTRTRRIVRTTAGLDELPPDAWDARVAQEFSAALADQPGGQTGSSALQPTMGDDGEVETLEWPAFPARIAACLGRGSTMRLLDWQGGGGTPHGRVRHQEEYAEWRVVRQDGRLRAIELTTELPEYWELLAGLAPERLLSLVAEFAATTTVAADAIFGELNPFNPATTPAQRIEAFRTTMLADQNEQSPRGPSSEFNNGRRAICCMIHRSNNLASLVRLVVTAARPLVVRDSMSGRTRFPSGAEAIRGLGAAATDGRSSDPLIVERIVRFVSEGRVIGFDSPIGVGIVDVQQHQLAQPDGNDVPASWFRLSRGVTGSDGQTRHQRLALTVPADVDFDLDDIVVRRTGERLRFGGQLAELVQLAVFVWTSPADQRTDVAPVDPAPDGGETASQCADETSSWAQFLTEADDGLAH